MLCRYKTRQDGRVLEAQLTGQVMRPFAPGLPRHFTAAFSRVTSTFMGSPTPSQPCHLLQPVGQRRMSTKDKVLIIASLPRIFSTISAVNTTRSPFLRNLMLCFSTVLSNLDLMWLKAVISRFQGSLFTPQVSAIDAPCLHLRYISIHSKLYRASLEKTPS